VPRPAFPNLGKDEVEVPLPPFPNLGKEDVEHQRSGKQIEVILTLFRNRQMEVPQSSTHLMVSGEEN
jgi:hypothetical protein